ncbi:helix-turn-helix domain-containing protein [Protofrankia symbiont of Coriaria ruscifolia]|uniref:helix-turn-helix domain-containing protein n=1 Tax=Protofrankia symbiont of Coriaria ruscifolia TaxID=1306542 RepID=UPI001F5F8DC3|nr:helix-turn-helix transcriptional regulator [Protofrankia symbiont of Coriaria ruscifolia]
MAVSAAELWAESRRLRALGWSYRRIALEWQRRYRLNARVAFRLAHGWTQEEAARRWNARWPYEDPPKTGKAFSYWEVWPGRGGRAPSTQTLQRLAELYLCRPGDLLDGDDFGRLDTGCDDVSREHEVGRSQAGQLIHDPREHRSGPASPGGGDPVPDVGHLAHSLPRHPA